MSDQNKHDADMSADDREVLNTTGREARRGSFGPGGGAGMPAERMDAVERVLELLEERVEVSPNIDFVLGALTWTSGMPDGGGEAIFGVARTAGWLAHAIEEYDEPDLRFRPRAHYVGAPPE